MILTGIKKYRNKSIFVTVSVFVIRISVVFSIIVSCINVGKGIINVEVVDAIGLAEIVSLAV